MWYDLVVDVFVDLFVVVGFVDAYDVKCFVWEEVYCD